MKILGYHWREAKNTRNFLDKFAQENQFDPLVAGNWYPISTIAIRKAKVNIQYERERERRGRVILYIYLLKMIQGRGILKYYKTLARAITQIYPEVDFDISKFRQITSIKNFLSFLHILFVNLFFLKKNRKLLIFRQCELSKG